MVGILSLMRPSGMSWHCPWGHTSIGINLLALIDIHKTAGFMGLNSRSRSFLI